MCAPRARAAARSDAKTCSYFHQMFRVLSHAHPCYATTRHARSSAARRRPGITRTGGRSSMSGVGMFSMRASHDLRSWGRGTESTSWRRRRDERSQESTPLSVNKLPPLARTLQGLSAFGRCEIPVQPPVPNAVHAASAAVSVECADTWLVEIILFSWMAPKQLNWLAGGGKPGGAGGGAIPSQIAGFSWSHVLDAHLVVSTTM